MKRGGWIAIDKRAANLLPKDRKYTEIEALLSLSIDIDKGQEGTISGYAALWNWGREKVRRFVHTLKSGRDYLTDGRQPGNRTGNHTGSRQAVRLIINNLQSDTVRASDTLPDTHPATTINPLSFNPETDKEKGNPSKGFHRHSPISFHQYVEAHQPTNADAQESIVRFLKRYRDVRGEDHPKLTESQWEECLGAMTYVPDGEYFDGGDISCAENARMTDAYFAKCSYRSNCDYHLPHFLSEGVRRNLYYETIHRGPEPTRYDADSTDAPRHKCQ